MARRRRPRKIRKVYPRPAGAPRPRAAPPAEMTRRPRPGKGPGRRRDLMDGSTDRLRWLVLAGPLPVVERAVDVVGDADAGQRVGGAAVAPRLPGLARQLGREPGSRFGPQVANVLIGHHTNHFRMHGYSSREGDHLIARTFRFAVRPRGAHRANALSTGRSWP